MSFSCYHNHNHFHGHKCLSLYTSSFVCLGFVAFLYLVMFSMCRPIIAAWLICLQMMSIVCGPCDFVYCFSNHVAFPCLWFQYCNKLDFVIGTCHHFFYGYSKTSLLFMAHTPLPHWKVSFKLCSRKRCFVYIMLFTCCYLVLTCSTWL